MGKRAWIIASLTLGLASVLVGCGGSDTESSGSGSGLCDDGNPCTKDVCDGASVTHEPLSAGAPCSAGGTVCDGAGQCVECLSADTCPGEDGLCQLRTCAAGKCGLDLFPGGTLLLDQTLGDCREDICDGQGHATTQTNNSDKPDDKNPCTTDTCTAGVPKNTPKTAGTTCGNGLQCDANGACVGCLDPGDCPGEDTPCQTRTCESGTCGFSNSPAGAPGTSTPNDCLSAACDGAGHETSSPDDADLPLDDGNPCTVETCVAGVPSHPADADGTPCSDGSACTLSDTCQSGVCAGGAAVVCAALDDCHLAGLCNPMNGQCDNPMKADGASCDDGDLCTTGNACKAGVCDIGSALACGVNQACDAGNCAPVPACDGVVGLPTPPLVVAGGALGAVADMNADGKLDFIRLGVSSGPGVSVQLGLGNGTFGAVFESALVAFPSSAAVADLNGNGVPDVAIAVPGQNLVGVLFGFPDGHLGAAQSYPAGGQPKGVRIADVDLDGKPDLVFLTTNAEKLSVLINVGNGLFGAKVDYVVGPIPESFAVADMNADGKPDFVVGSADTGVGVMLNQGNFVFAPRVDYDAGSRAIAVKDLDGDGALDVVAADNVGNTLDVLSNPGNGTLGPKTSYATSAVPVDVQAADVDGDGASDLIAVLGGGILDVRLQTGNGTFGPATLRPAMSSAVATFPFDDDGDGDIDLAVAADTRVQILHNPGSGQFETKLDASLPFVSSDLAAADLDGDNRVDILALSNGDGLLFARNLGGGAFDTSTKYPIGVVHFITPGDLNGDGHPDVVLQRFAGQSNQLSVMLNQGNGTLGAPSDSPIGAGLADLKLADMNGDGHVDIVYKLSNDTFVNVRFGAGDGTFGPAFSYSVGDLSGQIQIADMNGDGHPDIGFKASTPSLGVLLSNGNGTFAPKTAQILPAGLAEFALADLNGDGKPDFAAANNTQSALVVSMNNGTGTLGAFTTYPVHSKPEGIRALDMTGDGALDLVLTYPLLDAYREVSLFLNTGSGAFAPEARYDAKKSFTSAAFADFDGDGRPDIAVSSSSLSEPRVSLLYSRCDP
ncbi:MAG: VCBS repeat-containing protein [Polyangiaceae bacterium]